MPCESFLVGGFVAVHAASMFGDDVRAHLVRPGPEFAVVLIVLSSLISGLTRGLGLFQPARWLLPFLLALHIAGLARRSVDDVHDHGHRGWRWRR